MRGMTTKAHDNACYAAGRQAGRQAFISQLVQTSNKQEHTGQRRSKPCRATTNAVTMQSKTEIQSRQIAENKGQNEGTAREREGRKERRKDRKQRMTQGELEKRKKKRKASKIKERAVTACPKQKEQEGKLKQMSKKEQEKGSLQSRYLYRSRSQPKFLGCRSCFQPHCSNELHIASCS